MVDAEVDVAAGVGTRKLTDMGNAERLADRGKDRLRWVAGMGWLVWDGKRWKRDTTNKVVQEAKTTVRGIYGEAEGADDSELRAALSKHATRSESGARIDAMVKLAASEPRLVLEDVGLLDDIDNALNVQNGILDLDTLKLVPHFPPAYLTKLANAAYDPEAKCEFWEATLAYFLPDADVRRWVQMAAGYSMLGSYSEWLFIPYGKGANGKSTFLWALRRVLGDYACEAAPELLTEKREHSAASDAALADLRGTRLVTTIETGAGKRMAEALMKQLTGESRVKAKFMRENYFEFENQTAVWLATNHKPVVQGTDYGVWRRVRLIPFDVKVAQEHQRPPVEVKRALERERDGILRWLIDGLRMYRERGSLDPAPAVVAEATEAYRAEMDGVGEWLTERCELRAGAISSVKSVRESYADYCKETGRQALGSQRFNAELEEQHGLKRENTRLLGKQTKVWAGIELRVTAGVGE